jgi:hypothetical protein
MRQQEKEHVDEEITQMRCQQHDKDLSHAHKELMEQAAYFTKANKSAEQAARIAAEQKCRDKLREERRKKTTTAAIINYRED